MSRRMLWVMIAALGLALGGVAAAGGQSMPGRGPMGSHMMAGGGGMMGPRSEMRGMGMGCPLLMSEADVKVEKLDDGVAIRLTSKDPKAVTRIQKRAEIMRLLHELQQEELSD